MNIKKVFVIGSISQANKINSIAEKLSSQFEVKYVKPQPNVSFEELVSDAFTNIEWADAIVVLKKPDGTVGQGVTYEIEYAKRVHKTMYFFDEEDSIIS